MNHIGDVNKLVSDTPRTDKAWKTTHSVYEFTVEMKRMERELNAANKHIKRLIEAGERLSNEGPTGRNVLAWELAKDLE